MTTQEMLQSRRYRRAIAQQRKAFLHFDALQKRVEEVKAAGIYDRELAQEVREARIWMARAEGRVDSLLKSCES